MITASQTVVQIDGLGVPEKRFIVQWEVPSKGQIEINYSSLTDEQKAIFDAANNMFNSFIPQS